MIDPVIVRFFSKISIKSGDECWNWNSTLTHQGYGHFTLNGKKVMAHRLVYFIFNGVLPLYDENGKEIFVLHRCDNRVCCNPSHLYIGTHQDNMRDRQERKGTVRGEQNGKSIFNNNQVYEIKELIARGFPNNKIASLYNTSRQTINAIRKGISWGHIKRKGGE